MSLYPVIVSAIFLATAELSAAETPPLSKTGLKNIQLVTAAGEIQLEEPLTVGLLIDPEPGFHTYWKGPGVVGVATNIEWTLPEGFEAGPILWPPPEKTLMAGIGANGYRSEQILLIDIVVPEKIESDEVTIKAKATWMACSTSCHPGFEEFELTLPVNRSATSAATDEALAARFEAVRKSIPESAPGSWDYSLGLPASDLIELTSDIADLTMPETGRIHFFSYDHQVDSDETQQADLSEDGLLVLKLPRPDFAPNSPESLSGVLFHPDGWPGVDAKWVEISVPWPEGTFEDE